MTSNGIVQKLWNYCNILRDDRLSYGDYVEQLTFLLFLKMADEQMKPPYSRERIIPKNLDWASLERLDGSLGFKMDRSVLFLDDEISDSPSISCMSDQRIVTHLRQWLIVRTCCTRLHPGSKFTPTMAPQ